jgi:hypothetical protein
MSDWRSFAAELARKLEQALGAVRSELCGSGGRSTFRSSADTWSNLEIGEHVVLVDHYLLILADKIAQKSRARLSRGEQPGASPSRTDHLEKLARHDFRWPSPVHMLPTGTSTAAEIDARLGQQLDHCLALLHSMPSGEGALHRIRMSVVGEDDRLDLYQFLCVVALHAERHARAMRRNTEAFAQRAEP